MRRRGMEKRAERSLVVETRVVKPEPGVRVQGFYMGHRDVQGGVVYLLRTPDADYIVPGVHRLETLQRFPRRRHWVKIEFVDREDIGKGRSIWRVQILALKTPPMGVRGTLRRQKRRL